MLRFSSYERSGHRTRSLVEPLAGEARRKTDWQSVLPLSGYACGGAPACAGPGGRNAYAWDHLGRLTQDVRGSARGAAARPAAEQVLSGECGSTCKRHRRPRAAGRWLATTSWLPKIVFVFVEPASRPGRAGWQRQKSERGGGRAGQLANHRPPGMNPAVAPQLEVRLPRPADFLRTETADAVTSQTYKVYDGASHLQVSDVDGLSTSGQSYATITERYLYGQGADQILATDNCGGVALDKRA